MPPSEDEDADLEYRRERQGADASGEPKSQRFKASTTPGFSVPVKRELEPEIV
jgi:hypothetical protein